MAIRFSCECGKALAVRDDLAGKRIKCPACSSVVTVPAEESEEAEAPAAPAGPIRFSCDDCGKTLTVKPELAGKRVKCPGCATVLVVPAAGDSEEGIQTSRPKPAPAAASRSRFNEDEDEEENEERNQDEEEQEDEEEERPSKKKGKKKGRKESSSRTLILVAVVVLLLLGGGAGAWFFLNKKDDPKNPSTNRPGGGGQQPVNVAGFELVPRDALGMASFQVSKLANSDLGKKLLDFTRKENANELKMLEDATGLTDKDIERVTMVFSEQNAGWVIARASKMLDQQKLVAALPGAAQKNHNGKNYHFAQQASLAMYFVDAQTVLLTDKEQHLKKALDLQSPGTGALDGAVQLASANDVVVGVNGAKLLASFLPTPGGPGGGVPLPGGNQFGRQGGQPPFGNQGGIQPPLPGGNLGQPGGQFGGRPGGQFGNQGGQPGGPNPLADPNVQALLKVQLITGTLNFNNPIALEVAAHFPDSSVADSANKGLTQLLDMAKGFLALAQLGGGQGQQVGGIDTRPLLKEAATWLNQIQPKAEGSLVKALVNIDPATVNKLVDEAIKGAKNPAPRPGLR